MLVVLRVLFIWKYWESRIWRLAAGKVILYFQWCLILYSVSSRNSFFSVVLDHSLFCIVLIVLTACALFLLYTPWGPPVHVGLLVHVIQPDVCITNCFSKEWDESCNLAGLELTNISAVKTCLFVDIKDQVFSQCKQTIWANYLGVSLTLLCN